MFKYLIIAGALITAGYQWGLQNAPYPHPPYNGPRVVQSLTPPQWKGKHLDRKTLADAVAIMQRVAKGENGRPDEIDQAKRDLFLVSEAYRLGFDDCDQKYDSLEDSNVVFK